MPSIKKAATLTKEVAVDIIKEEEESEDNSTLIERLKSVFIENHKKW